MRLERAGRPMTDRTHFGAGLLHPPEAGFNHRTGLVSEGNVLRRECIVVCYDDKLAVEFLRRSHLGRIQLWPTMPVGAEVAAVTLRRHQGTGCLLPSLTRPVR